MDPSQFNSNPNPSLPRGLTHTHFQLSGVTLFHSQNNSATRWQQNRLKFPTNLSNIEYFLWISFFRTSVAFSHAEVHNYITADLVTVEYFIAVRCCAHSLHSMVYNDPFVVQQQQQVCIRPHVSADNQGCNTEPTTRQSPANQVLPAYEETTVNF